MLRNAGLFPAFVIGLQEPSYDALWRRFSKRYKNPPETTRTAHEFARAGCD